MTYVIVEPCIGTKNASCVDVCPVSCIYEAEDMYYINPDECIECGASAGSLSGGHERDTVQALPGGHPR